MSCLVSSSKSSFPSFGRVSVWNRVQAESISSRAPDQARSTACRLVSRLFPGLGALQVAFHVMPFMFMVYWPSRFGVASPSTDCRKTACMSRSSNTWGIRAAIIKGATRQGRLRQKGREADEAYKIPRNQIRGLWTFNGLLHKPPSLVCSSLDLTASPDTQESYIHLVAPD